jgi:hypothetical protein
MELEIHPEPTDAERDAISTAVARAGVEAPQPIAYASPWRAAGLREATGHDDEEP